jgi:hypothetical protein
MVKKKGEEEEKVSLLLKNLLYIVIQYTSRIF